MRVLDAGQARLLRAKAQLVAGGRRLGSVGEIADRVFALQSQDPVAAALGLRARGRGLTAQDVARAVEAERSVVRGWLMRGTLHTVPAGDYRWLLGLLGPVAVKASVRRHRELGLDDALCGVAEELIVRTLAAEGPATRAVLTRRLAEVGVEPGGQAAFHLLRRAALRGRICFGPGIAGEPAFALLDDWLPARGDGPEGDDAVLELARRYLRAHSPAAAEDFANWSGLPVPAARRAWGALAAAGETVAVSVLDEPCALPADREDEPAEPGAEPDVRLLPMYDGYLLGHRSRATAVPAPYERRVRPGGGQIRATVTVDGRVAGVWTRADGGRSVRVEPFGDEVADPATTAAEAADVARFLGTR